MLQNLNLVSIFDLYSCLGTRKSKRSIVDLGYNLALHIYIPGKYNLLRKTVLHEVKVQITNPLNMNSHHPSTDGQAAIVPTSCSHNLTWRWEILKSKISSS